MFWCHLLWLIGDIITYRAGTGRRLFAHGMGIFTRRLCEFGYERSGDGEVLIVLMSPLLTYFNFALALRAHAFFIFSSNQ